MHLKVKQEPRRQATTNFLYEDTHEFFGTLCMGTMRVLIWAGQYRNELLVISY